MFKIAAACAALVALAALATADAQLHAQVQPSPVSPSPVKRTILQKTDVPGTNLELVYATVEIAAGFKAGRHFHPGLAMAFVVEGEFWFQLDGQPEKVLRAGESLTTPDRAIHNEGALGQPVKLTAVYVLEKGKPMVSPAP
jgi:quercetin dioxygenase-like cupin family protein